MYARIRSGEDSGFVATCDQLNAVTQGATLDETVANLREVVGLALDETDLSIYGLSERPLVIVTMEVEPAAA